MGKPFLELLPACDPGLIHGCCIVVGDLAREEVVDDTLLEFGVVDKDATDEEKMGIIPMEYVPVNVSSSTRQTSTCVVEGEL